MKVNTGSMRPWPITSRLTLMLCLLAGWGSLMAQPGASVNLVKPKKYENRTLASERNTEKPLNPIGRFNQDLNTVYNFHFNAQNKLNEIISRAKQSNRDDYTKLLPFYNYTLDNTAGQKTELDSVILRCNDAILLHDLRSDWVDDMYLLMGKGYFYRKTFDSAAITFQYVNYAFQPRKKDEVGYDKFVGSNSNESGNAYTISTKERSNPVTAAVLHTPARNESILWLARTLVETGEYNAAASLFQTLRTDKNFPSRLNDDLEELQAYWFYRNGQWDSTARHLAKALDNAPTAQERARWEYLVAQLYERSDRSAEADKYYEKAITHTTDPVMEAWARINQIRLITGEDEAQRIKKNIEELEKMAKRSKYEDYRPIIYYAAAQLELQRKETGNAMNDLTRSIKSNFNDPALKNKAFAQLGDLAFGQRKYDLAFHSYDSVDLSDPEVENAESLRERKAILAQVVYHEEQVNLEDSLQHIASLPEKERNDYLKSLSKKLRKEKGLKEEEEMSAGYVVDMNHISGIDNKTQTDLFSNNTNLKNINRNGQSNADWYFYNPTQRSQGFKQFQSAWGNRPNLDNWRRISSVRNQVAITKAAAAPKDANDQPDLQPNKRKTPDDITVAGLQANLPMTPEALKTSNDSMETSLHALGKLFQDKLGDCDAAIAEYENLLNRFPTTRYKEEALFALTYCYAKAGNTQKANFYKGFLAKDFNNSKYLRYLNDPKAAQKEANAFKENATKTYNDIYNDLIAGNFDKALAGKKKADSTYGEQYWTPQLLYIESIYYVKQRQDSLAISTLNKIGNLYPDSKIAPKAASLADVVKRRAEIEGYLTNLKVERKKDDSIPMLDDTPAPKAREVVEKKPDPVVTTPPPVVKAVPVKVDSTKFKAPVSEKKVEGYVYKPASPHIVMLLLDKVDVVYVSEARNAMGRFNRENYSTNGLEVTMVPLDDNRKMVLVSGFPDVVTALEYQDKARAKAAGDIFPWLPADKYSFMVITPDNLEMLKTRKDMDNYRKFLKESLPGKF